MKLSFRARGKANDVIIGGRRYHVNLEWSSLPILAKHAEIDLISIYQNSRQFETDMSTWLRERVEAHELTDQENVDMTKFFVMDHSPTMANLPAYLFEATCIRARPFGLGIEDFNVKIHLSVVGPDDEHEQMDVTINP